MEDRNSILIFGAGCIGRGLLGELAGADGWRVTFVESDPDYAARLREAGSYGVRLVGRSESRTRVHDYRVLWPTDEKEIAECVAACTFAATAVGGQHLRAVGKLLAPCLPRRRAVLNVLVCENWPHADEVLGEALREAGADAQTFACVPASVERMVRRDAVSLDLIGESLESVYVDGSRWNGSWPPLAGLLFRDDLAPYYARKLFTNNAGHAALAYEGFLAGHELLCDAHEDARIRARVEALLDVAADMLAREHGLIRVDLAEHVDTLMTHRFSNRELADTVHRVARDPLRKLGPEERLVGLLRRLEKHGLPIRPVCRTIAAAMHYRAPDDGSAEKLQALIGSKAAAHVLEDVCGLRREEEAHVLCLQEYERI